MKKKKKRSQYANLKKESAVFLKSGRMYGLSTSRRATIKCSKLSPSSRNPNVSVNQSLRKDHQLGGKKNDGDTPSPSAVSPDMINSTSDSSQLSDRALARRIT
ncbi:hypothetical protein RRG08_064673 [Elysia crispata]|uniref:Uncharacterized protein n=1 Tax=Elysia crispata TaxID=231223 RepID=A0AAE0Y187_9GAST|nr:hypothetical protein RRG08_064460 [Elysia crispata]KAK3796856.1 hypothetical protein RRG08_064673 [Elysia crispata]